MLMPLATAAMFFKIGMLIQYTERAAESSLVAHSVFFSEVLRNQTRSRPFVPAMKHRNHVEERPFRAALEVLQRKAFRP